MSNVLSRASIAFGYNLGGLESSDGWRFKEVDENGFAKLEWYDDEKSDEDVESFADYANRVIAEKLGHASRLTSIPNDGARYAAAMNYAGAQVVTGGFESDRYFLITHEVETTPSNAVDLSFRKLSLEQVQNNWSSTLARAITTLGITPDVDHPRWMLIASYD